MGEYLKLVKSNNERTNANLGTPLNLETTIGHKEKYLVCYKIKTGLPP